MTRGIRLLVTAGVVAVATLLTSYQLAGSGGVLTAAGLIWLAILVALRAGVREMPHAPTGWVRVPPIRRNADYHSFRTIESALSTASLSARDYDLSTRPVLARLAAAKLAAQGVSAGDRNVRDRVGERLWPWLAPVAPSGSRDRGSGIDLRTLTELIECVEGL